MRFHATVELGGKSATGIPVPDEVVTGLGSGRRPSVLVTVGGHSYRSTVGSVNGRFMLPLSAENRQAAGVAAGDEVDVQVELDTAPRVIEVPEDFAAALAGDTAAKATFDALSYSHQRAHVMSITDAKTEATRQRRIDKAVATLHAGRSR